MQRGTLAGSWRNGERSRLLTGEVGVRVPSIPPPPDVCLLEALLRETRRAASHFGVVYLAGPEALNLVKVVRIHPPELITPTPILMAWPWSLTVRQSDDAPRPRCAVESEGLSQEDLRDTCGDPD